MSSILEFPPAPSVTLAVDLVKVALGSLSSLVAAGHLEGLSESELLAATAEVQAIASRAGAVAVSMVAEVRDGEVAKSEGFTSTTRFLETRAGLSKSESRAQVALGEKLQWEFEATQQAWLAGEITEGAVQVITSLIPRKLKGLPEAEYYVERTRLEAMALHHARTTTVAGVKRAIERAAIVADPAGALDAAVVAKRNEFLSFTPVEDGVEVRGFLAWDTAGVVLPCFDQANDAMYRNGQLAEDYSDDADFERAMTRTPSLRRKRREHRNAQIFAELATRLLDDGELGTKHAQRPHLTVTVHADDFAAGLGGDILLPGFGPVPVPTRRSNGSSATRRSTPSSRDDPVHHPDRHRRDVRSIHLPRSREHQDLSTRGVSRVRAIRRGDHRCDPATVVAGSLTSPASTNPPSPSSRPIQTSPRRRSSPRTSTTTSRGGTGSSASPAATSSTSDGPAAPHHPRSDAPCRSATVAAPCPDATPTPPAAKRTTSPTGSTTGRRRSRTWSCCAPSTTTWSTKDAGASNATPTWSPATRATSPSPLPPIAPEHGAHERRNRQ
jgi:hypothetical protein